MRIIVNDEIHYDVAIQSNKEVVKVSIIVFEKILNYCIQEIIEHYIDFSVSVLAEVYEISILKEVNFKTAFNKDCTTDVRKSST